MQASLARASHLLTAKLKALKEDKEASNFKKNKLNLKKSLNAVESQKRRWSLESVNKR